MELNIEITPIKRFKVKINGQSIGEFNEESSWEGFVKLQCKKGIIIVGYETTLFADIFHNIFSEEKQLNYKVMKITPGLIPTDKIKKETQTLKDE